MIVVGLTGGIATGKSTVSEILAAAGAWIVDADRLAREAVRPGRPAWQAIVTHFGSEVLREGGEIDRERLSAVVFHEPAQKAVLDRIVHPAVFAAMADRLAALETEVPGGLVVLDVPLLFETGMDRDLDTVIVVYAPRQIQLERLIRRNGYTRDEALARIDAQMDIEEKRLRATLLIDNSGAIQETRRQTLAAYRRLCGRAAG